MFGLLKKIVTAGIIAVFAMGISVFAAEDSSTIPERAFENCVGLSEFDIPEYVSYIDDYAFYNTALEKVSFSDNVKKIGKYAYAECNELKTVYFYGKSTVIEDTAFDNNSGLLFYCYKNSIAHNFAINNNIDYVLFDYDNDLKAEDILYDNNITATGLDIYIDGTVGSDEIKITGDKNNLIQLVSDISVDFNDENYNKYLLFNALGSNSSGYVEMELSKDDTVFLYIDILENTEIIMESGNSVSSFVPDTGKSVLRLTADSDGLYKVYLNSGSAAVYRIAVNKAANEIKFVYGDADNDSIVSATDASIVLRKAKDNGIRTVIELYVGSATPIDVDGDGFVTATDASLVLTKAKNSGFRFTVDMT